MHSDNYLHAHFIEIVKWLGIFFSPTCSNWLSHIFCALHYRELKSEHLQSNAHHQCFLHTLHSCQLLNQCASFSQHSLLRLLKWCAESKQRLEFCLSFSNNPSRNRKFAWSAIVILLFTSWVILKPVNQMSSLLRGSTLLTTVAQSV